MAASSLLRMATCICGDGTVFKPCLFLNTVFIILPLISIACLSCQ